jgi:hypothetical protein
MISSQLIGMESFREFKSFATEDFVHTDISKTHEVILNISNICIVLVKVNCCNVFFRRVNYQKLI